MPCDASLSDSYTRGCFSSLAEMETLREIYLWIMLNISSLDKFGDYIYYLIMLNISSLDKFSNYIYYLIMLPSYLKLEPKIVENWPNKG